ncbi:MAG: orotidine-5'-phosphate decarboxylase [Chloroflexi bacterium]|nr:orotidine-5'-phosphate decarboxylase [Chloroflexota bacterium]
MSFYDRLREAVRAHRSLVCVGLDPDPALMPAVDVLDFNRAVVDATWELVAAYKLNLAFYEAMGLPGLEAMRKTVGHISKPVIVIGDGKRGDIGNTSRAYAHALFDVFGFDAATVNPYLGGDGIAPFADYADRGVFLLCRTSNDGARDFQDLTVLPSGRRLYEAVAEMSQRWNHNSNVGLVVGATYPEELQRIRELCPEMPFLIPGVGAQGGDLEAAARFGAQGGGALINSSRGIIYASKAKDFAEAARRAASSLRDDINRFL